MAVSVIEETGPLSTGYEGSASTTTPGEVGRGVVIGDGYVLTAGHVVFEWDRVSGASPNIITNPSLAGKIFDYRGYAAEYARQASLLSASGTPPANTTIEGKLASYDSVVLKDQSVSAGGNSPGLVAFVQAADLTNAAFAVNDGSATIRRYAQTTVTGTILSAAGGRLEFSRISNSGDSGGAYVLNALGKSFVIGTHSGNNPTSAAGTYFRVDEWRQVTDLMTQGHAGNLTSNEPTNLLVGSTGAETLLGSLRADVILGRDGADTLDGGDAAVNASAAWGNDQLFGGVGNDTFLPGFGADLFHGGDRSQTASSAAQLDGDGDDTADYRSLTASDITRGIQIQVGGAAASTEFASNADATHANYVTDLGRKHDTDTLISIETVTATAANDVLKIAALDAARVSTFDSTSNSHTSGLLHVDLGGAKTADLIDFSDMGIGVTAFLNSPDPYVFATGNDALRLFVAGAEQILGSAHEDVIFGSSGSENLAGNGGNDEIRGGAGVDFLFGGAGADLLYGEEGNDRIIIGGPTGIEESGGTFADGGAGNDFIMLERAATRHTSDVAASIQLANGDSGDRLVWNGYRLTGGTFKVIVDPEPQSDGVPTRLPVAGYVGVHGEVYFWNPSANTLQIYLPDNTELNMSFDNGDYGLRFAAAPANPYGPDVERTNNAHDQSDGFLASPLVFFSGIAGRQEAFATAGDVNYPRAPSAGRAGSQPNPAGDASAAFVADGASGHAASFDLATEASANGGLADHTLFHASSGLILQHDFAIA